MLRKIICIILFLNLQLVYADMEKAIFAGGVDPKAPSYELVSSTLLFEK